MVNEAAISHQLLSHLRHHSLFALRFSLRANQLSTFANVGRSRIGFGVLVDSGSQGNSEKRRAKGEKRFVLFLASNAALRVSNKCVLRRFLKQLVAVVVGSLLYFFVLMPHLPLAGRHQPFRIDLGLVVNLWVCLVLYGIVEWLDRKWRCDGPAGEGRKR
jgi:hypothetical protein